MSKFCEPRHHLSLCQFKLVVGVDGKDQAFYSDVQTLVKRSVSGLQRVGGSKLSLDCAWTLSHSRGCHTDSRFYDPFTFTAFTFLFSSSRSKMFSNFAISPFTYLPSKCGSQDDLRRRVSPENMFSLKTRPFIMTPAPPGPHTTQTVLTQSRQGIGIQQVVRLSCNKHLPPFNSLHGTICGSCQCTARIAVFCIMLVWS